MRRDERGLGPAPSGAPRPVVSGWSPGAIPAILAGLFLAVLGMLVLIHSGLRIGSLGSRTGTALSFRQSELLAIVEIAFGIAVVWLAGDFPWYGRPAVVAGGVLAAGFGIALAGWASSLAGTFGGDAASGWLWIAVGALVVVSGLIPRRSVSRRAAPTP